MRKIIVLLLFLFGITFLVACDNTSSETEYSSSTNISSLKKTLETDHLPSNNTSSSEEFLNYDDTESSELKEISVLSDKVVLLIPKTFEIMSEELAKIKYPSESRPTVIYTNESGSINIAFNHTNNQFSSDDISDYKDMMTETFTNLYPSAQWYKSDVETINDLNIGILELITPAIDTEIYNLIWFTDLDKRLLLLTFNCTIEEMTEWEPIAKSILESFRLQ